MFVGTCLYLRWRHFPHNTISPEVAERIKQMGLIHFTTKNRAELILKEGLSHGRAKAIYSREKDFVWMYIYDTTEFALKRNIIHKKGWRRKCNEAIVFRNVTDSQLAAMQWRSHDEDIVFKGKFETDSMTVLEAPRHKKCLFLVI